MFAGAVAALIFVGVMLNEDYREAIVAIAVIFVVALVGFAAFGRHRLVLSPEEEYAMSGGLHGDPQAEGYGAIDVEDIDPEARSRTVVDRSDRPRPPARPKQPAVLAGLRVPLDAEAEPAAGRLDRLDDAVLGPRRRRQPGSDPVQCLVVVAVHRGGRAQQPVQRAARRRPHLPPGEQPRARAGGTRRPRRRAGAAAGRRRGRR